MLHRFVPAPTVRNNATFSTNKLAFNEAFQALVDDFGEHMPHQHATHPADHHKKEADTSKRMLPLTFLHCGLFDTKAAVFREFRSLGIVPRSVNDSTLRKWWKESFWNVRIKNWQPFAKCEECIEHRAKLLSALTEAVRDKLKETQASHREQVRVVITLVCSANTLDHHQCRSA